MYFKVSCTTSSHIHFYTIDTYKNIQLKKIMNESNNLSLEQKFKLVVYKKKLTKLNDKQSRDYLLATLKQMMIKDNVIKYFLKNSGL